MSLDPVLSLEFIQSKQYLSKSRGKLNVPNWDSPIILSTESWIMDTMRPGWEKSNNEIEKLPQRTTRQVKFHIKSREHRFFLKPRFSLIRQHSHFSEANILSFSSSNITKSMWVYHSWFYEDAFCNLSLLITNTEMNVNLFIHIRTQTGSIFRICPNMTQKCK